MVELSKLAKLSKGKGAPPPASHSEDNLTKPPSRQKVPLQLKISPELRREFKGYAIERDSEVSELFIRIWEFYKANHG